MAETIVLRKQVHGEVEFNDGEFAEIQTVGIDGIEKDLLMQTIQVHRGDTGYSCEQFQRKVNRLRNGAYMIGTVVRWLFVGEGDPHNWRSTGAPEITPR